MRNLFFPIALSLAASAAAAPPHKVEIGFEVSRNGSVIAEVTHRLEHDGKTYALAESWKGRGLVALAGEINRSSRGSIVADGLRPAEFEDRRSRREARRIRGRLEQGRDASARLKGEAADTAGNTSGQRSRSVQLVR